MFCGRCGKEMSNTEKFCPYCGAANPKAAAARPASGAMPAVPVPLAGKSLYRVALTVLGALHVLIFFFMSYGRMGDKLVRQFASELGIKMAASLTGPNAIRFYGGLADYNVSNAEENYWSCILFFGLPMVMGILVAVMNLMNNSRKSYTLSIIFSALGLLGYLVLKIIMPVFEDMYFELNGNINIVLIITAVQLAAAVMGRSRDKAAV